MNPIQSTPPDFPPNSPPFATFPATFSQKMLWSSLIQELREMYPCHTIILYGSFVRGDVHPQSDIDMLCVCREGEATTDTRLWCGHRLDAWIYPESAFTEIQAWIHLNEGTVLWSDSTWGETFLLQVRNTFQQGPTPQSSQQKQHQLQWVQKMLERIQRDDTESHYRRHWLLMELLPTYFSLHNQWYLGPKRALHWLADNDPTIYRCFVQILHPACTLDAMVAQIREFLHHLEQGISGEHPEKPALRNCP